MAHVGAPPTTQVSTVLVGKKLSNFGQNGSEAVMDPTESPKVLVAHTITIEPKTA